MRCCWRGVRGGGVVVDVLEVRVWSRGKGTGEWSDALGIAFVQVLLVELVKDFSGHPDVSGQGGG